MLESDRTNENAGAEISRGRPGFHFFSTLVLGLVTVGLAGCVTNPIGDVVSGPSYQPSNVYREAARLSPTFKRLAVLPLATVVGDRAEIEFGRETLGPILIEELGRVKRFEIVSVSPDQLLRWSGRSAWTGEEKLPQDFLEKLLAATDADGVMFCHLTQYRPYGPLAIGWRMRLVSLDSLGTVWAVDEVFDAREPAVANAARRFAQAHPEPVPQAGHSRRVLLSPRRFGQYTACEILKTLPLR